MVFYFLFINPFAFKVYALSKFLDFLSFSGNTNDPSITMMAASICALIFDFTSEDALMNHLNFEPSSLGNLSQLIAKSLAAWGQVKFIKSQI